MSGVRVPPRPLKESRDPRFGGWGKNVYRLGGYTIEGTSTSFWSRCRRVCIARFRASPGAERQDGGPRNDSRPTERRQGTRCPGSRGNQKSAAEANQYPRPGGRSEGGYRQQSRFVRLFADGSASTGRCQSFGDARSGAPVSG